MSSVAISGNASGTGTLTIATPNTNTNYTFTLPAETGTALTSNSPGYNAFKNRIINGAMVIDQRNAGASVTPVNGAYTLDRWQAIATVTSKYSVQRNAGSVTPPVGFINYLGATSLSAYSVVAGDYFAIQQLIEGFNIADFGWGTANASTVTLSFNVRSSLTGTFGGSIRNSNGNRSYPFTYTISSANTWTSISITIAGDTTGTWSTDNTAGIQVFFGLGVGSTYSGTAGAWAGANYLSATGATSVVGTNGATFYITGVQFEKGSTATSFDYRPYGTELQLCQRYFQTWGGTATYARVATGFTVNATTAEVCIPAFPVQMRTTPSLGYSAVGDWMVGIYNASFVCTAISIAQATPINCDIILTSSGLTANYTCFMNANNTTSARLTLSSEL